MKKTAVIVSGYFNPVHKGHIDLFKKAKSKGDFLFVIVNNDLQRSLKGSKEFMLQEERILILNELKIIDKVILSIDNDKTIIKTLRYINDKFSKEFRLIFANGGDQNNESIPEAILCNKIGINLIDGLGNKIQSSSWILNKKIENK
tara:strand:+ start:1991 stop:2428 length:438 start_codon:yes stop_codon:yes gene_type:complete